MDFRKARIVTSGPKFVEPPLDQENARWRVRAGGRRASPVNALVEAQRSCENRVRPCSALATDPSKTPKAHSRDESAPETLLPKEGGAARRFSLLHTCLQRRVKNNVRSPLEA